YLDLSSAVLGVIASSVALRSEEDVRAGSNLERGVHGEPEGREEERFVDEDDPRGWEEEGVPEAEEERVPEAEEERVPEAEEGREHEGEEERVPEAAEEEWVPEAAEEERVPKAEEEHGAVREDLVEVIEAPVEAPRMGDEVTADAGAVEGPA